MSLFFYQSQITLSFNFFLIFKEGIRNGNQYQEVGQKPANTATPKKNHRVEPCSSEREGKASPK